MSTMDLTELDNNAGKSLRSSSSSMSPTRFQSVKTFKKLFIMIGSLYLGTFLVALDTTIINTALPAITNAFHALDDLAWYGSTYLLTLTALQPNFGKLYKPTNTKYLSLASIILFESTFTLLAKNHIHLTRLAVGYILCASARSSPMFVSGRAVAGSGAAGLMQGSFAIVTKTVPLSQRPFFFGLFVSAFGVSIGIGPVLGGFLADKGIWAWCFGK
jgi:MFS family permease